jgi:hypothetical protein
VLVLLRCLWISKFFLFELDSFDELYEDDLGPPYDFKVIDWYGCLAERLP